MAVEIHPIQTAEDSTTPTVTSRRYDEVISRKCDGNTDPDASRNQPHGVLGKKKDPIVTSSENVSHLTYHDKGAANMEPAGKWPPTLMDSWTLGETCAREAGDGHGPVSLENGSNNRSDESIISSGSDDSEAAAHSKAFCWGLCCVQGCIWGILGMVYFFVFLPSGFLMIMYGTNNKLAWATATGALLLLLSTFGVPALCVCVRWYRRKQRDRRHDYRVQRDKAVARQTYENPLQDTDSVDQPPDVSVITADGSDDPERRQGDSESAPHHADGAIIL